jgi:hypothetical protein
MRISKFFSGRPLDELPGRPINQDERQLTGSRLCWELLCLDLE